LNTKDYFLSRLIFYFFVIINLRNPTVGFPHDDHGEDFSRYEHAFCVAQDQTKSSVAKYRGDTHASRLTFASQGDLWLKVD
jgi:hypothetical protein